MATDKSRKLSAKVVASDKNTFVNLKAISNYAPANKNFEVATGTAAASEMLTKQDLATQANSAAKTARDNARDSEWNFHEFILGAKSQVAAQFGDDSNEYQSLGLKKKSERKRPAPKKGKGPKGA